MSITENLKSFGWSVVKLISLALVFGSGVYWTLAARRFPELLDGDNVRSLITLVVLGLLFVFGVWINRAPLFWKISLVILAGAFLWTFDRADNKAALGMLAVLSFFTLLFAASAVFDEICSFLDWLCDWHDRFVTNRIKRRANHARKQAVRTTRNESESISLFN